MSVCCWLYFFDQFVVWSTLKAGKRQTSIVLEDPLYQDSSLPLSGAFALGFEGQHVLMRGKDDAHLYAVGCEMYNTYMSAVLESGIVH